MVQKNCLKNKIIFIGGPTGVGKSEYAIDLAIKYNGEIISADSVQIYRGLNIGSGKVTKEEMRGIPHHLIDIINPDEEFSVVDFIEAAHKCIDEIFSKGKLPIVCGGTGFYINAFLNDYECGVSEPDYKLREKLKKMEKENGKGYLANLLFSLNPECTVNKNDTTRIIRQLELYYSDNKQDLQTKHNTYNALLAVLDADRDELDRRASIRIDKMFEAGFENEVKNLSPYYGFRCTDTVGYKEMKQGIIEGLSRDVIKSNMRQNYHWLIKKQQTFFRWLKWENKIFAMNWNFDELNKRIEDFLNE